MITSRRTLLQAAGLTATMGALAACGGSGGSAAPGGDRTVVVWDRAGAQATIKQEWFETWNAGPGAEAGITVQYEPQAADKYEELVRVAFQTGRAPDVFHTPSSQLGGFVAAGWVQPLTDVVDASVLEASAPYLSDLSELVWGGEPYAVPTTSFTNRLVINRALFEQAGLDPDAPPATFSDLITAATALNGVAEGVSGIALPTKWVGFRQWIVDLPVMAGNADLANGMFDLAAARYDSTAYTEVVETYRQLIADGLAYPGAATLDTDVASAAFANGEVAMMITSSSVVAVLSQLESTVDVVAAPLPVPDGTTLVRSPMNAGYPYGIAGTTEDAEAAGQVVAALAGDGIQEALAEGDAPPLNDAVWDSEIVQGKDLLLSFRPGETDQQWPKNPNAVVPIEGPGLDQTIVSLVIEPGTDISSTLTDLQERYQAAWETAVDNGDVDPAEFTR